MTLPFFPFLKRPTVSPDLIRGPERHAGFLRLALDSRLRGNDVLTSIALSNAAFQGNADQLLRLDSKFHRQGLHHFLTETIDDQRDGLFLADPTGQTIEQLILTDPAGRCLMF